MRPVAWGIPIALVAIVATMIRTASCETSLSHPEPPPPCEPTSDDGQRGRDEVADRLSLSFRPKVGVSRTRDEFADTSAIEHVSPLLEDDDVDMVCSAWGTYHVERRELVAGLTCVTRHRVDVSEMIWLRDCADGCHGYDRTTSRDIEVVVDTRGPGLPGLRMVAGHAVTVDWVRKMCRSANSRVKIYGENTRTEFTITSTARESLCLFADEIDAEIESTRTPEP